jgi:amino acid adenylation domain-containing protein
VKPEIEHIKSRLSPSKQQLLKKLLDSPATMKRAAPSIPRQPRRSEYPLSFAQLRFWIASQLNPEVPVYSIVRAFRLSGLLDMATVRKSVEKLVERHAVLRTTFHEVEEGTVQVVENEIACPFIQADLTGRRTADLGCTLAELIRQEAYRPFDLHHGPLVRFLFVTLGEKDHALVVAMHHIVTDDWSTQVLFREFSAFYSNLSFGLPLSLAELPIEYTDFAIWQRQLIQSGKLSSQIAYWKQKLADMPPSLNLPTKIKSAATSLIGARFSLPVRKELWEGLKSLCQTSTATLFEVLLTAFEVLLAYYTNEDDIVVSTVVSSRDRPELEHLAGCLINTVPLRIKLADDCTFTSVLKQVREVVLEAQSNKEVPFEHLLEILQPGMTDIHASLARILFSLQNAHEVCLSLPGVRVEPIAPEHASSTFDLTLVPEQTSEGLNIVLQYSVALFDERTIRVLIGHYLKILEVFVFNPGQHISELLLLSEDEKKQLQVWHEACIDKMLLPDLFEAQAARIPDAVAAICGANWLSYRELNNRANKLANYLIHLGAGPEMKVAIVMERSLEMIVAMLGILKSGAAYVPLDPIYPAERLIYTLLDSGSQVLLTQATLIPQLPSFACTVIQLDAESAQIETNSSGNLRRTIDPENAAYIIYTSGSTGKPKGAVIRHGSVATLVHWAHELFSAEDLSGVLASTSLCFDLSVFEILVTLSCGGSVVVVENALELASMAGAKRVTLINTVPSIMRELVLMNAIPASVQTINIAGEPLSAELVDAIYTASRATRVFNLYGPSEDTTYSTYALLHRGDHRVIPIGRSITNTQVYVLNRWLQPLPEGVAGELYIAGEGLARGYLNRTDLTAQRFVPNPFSTTPGERLYRTGDLVRFLSDGSLEFLGRMDHQVKVRGYRIELGEIESALEEHQSVGQAVVVVRGDERGGSRLVAYVVTVNRGQITLNDLREHLISRLPRYMLPDKVITLPSLPVTVNGKIDRSRLPDSSLGISFETEYTPPGTLEEETLCKLWEEVLQRGPVGVNQDFFALGGNSLLALRISSLARTAFGIELPLRVFFEARTITNLAAYIGRQRGEEQRIDTLMNILQYELHQKQGT